MGLFSGIAKVVKGAVTGFNPVGMLASAAVNAVVGKYQTRQQNKAIEAANAKALERESTQFERLRDSAVRAGFNPLTALRSGMFQQANLFAKEADTFRGDLFGGLAKAALAFPQARFDAEMRDLERREREANIGYVGALSSLAMQRGTGFNPNPNVLPPLTAVNAMDAVPLFDPTGNQIEVPLSLAHSMRLEPYMMIGAELYEQMLGELAAEGIGLRMTADSGLGHSFTRAGWGGGSFAPAPTVRGIANQYTSGTLPSGSSSRRDVIDMRLNYQGNTVADHTINQ